MAVPSRVGLLISILRLNLVLPYGIPPEFRGGGVGLLYRFDARGDSKRKGQPGKVVNPARGQLNRKNEYFSVPVRT